MTLFRRLAQNAIAVLVPFLLCIASYAATKTVASTIPANGDLNPYGVAVVPSTIGALTQGNILVSNFNNSKNLQGTGTTIVQITPDGTVSLFAQIDASKLPGPCPGGIGLTTALVALKSGWVVVGSLPTKDGTAATAKAGCLLILDSRGTVVQTLFGSLINGPWDMTAFDGGSNASLFVTNVLNGTVAGGGKIVHAGTVLRLDLTIAGNTIPSLQSMTIVGSGFSEKTDPKALVVGPTGVGLGYIRSSNGGTRQVLYVADSLNNRIAEISDPVTRTTSVGTGITVSMGLSLNDPLGLDITSGGNIVSVNGANGFAVFTSPMGQQYNKILLDSSGSPPGAGALFGLQFVSGQGLYYVDDATNTLNLFQ